MPSVELQTLPKSGSAWLWIAQALVLVMPIASGITLHILPFLSQGKIKLNPLTARKAMTLQPGIQLFICWLYIAKKLYLK
jgi:hypothetical protein